MDPHAELRIRWRSRAQTRLQRIVLGDGDDPRVVAAAAVLTERGWCHPVFVDPDEEDALAAGMRLVASGDAAGYVGGVAVPTAQVLLAAARHVGRTHGVKVISSSFLMLLPDGRSVQFADCGVVVAPDARKLAAIASSSAETYRQLTGNEPRVAMLSFSTRGSGSHESVDTVRRATEMLREATPDLIVDGELQFDAAFVPAVAAAKTPESPLAGNANVFVFPDLNSANIGYKIAERIGGATALGPLLQGFRAPVHDLSRGCSTEDIVDIAVIAAVQAIEQQTTGDIASGR